MAIESGNSNQNRGISAKRYNIPQAPSVGTLNLPSNVTKLIAKNVGSQSVRINFNSDGSSDYWTLDPGEQFPVTIDIQGSTVVNATAMGGTSTIQAIFWG